MKQILMCMCFAFFNQLSGSSNAGNILYPGWIIVAPNTNNLFIRVVGNEIEGRDSVCGDPVANALESFPLIDGHNDFAFSLYTKLKNNLTSFNFDTYLKNVPGWEDSHTDMPRLRKGKVGGQFWSAFVFCETQFKDSVAKTLEQIDVIKRLININSKDMQFTTTADGIVEAFKAGKIASLIGIEGGHSIDSRLGVLRMYYELGVRYLTLTHSCDTPWATTATDPNYKSRGMQLGLTNFGKKVVLEMNRLGMLVDLSHVSKYVMFDAIMTSVAPVIFSHSSSYAVNNHPRNVEDVVLKMLKKNRGIIMVTFYPGYVGGGDHATVDVAINHINHIVDVIGPDHVGIGGDFDGIPKTLIGFEDVSKYPNLLQKLFYSNPRRWTQRNLEKLIGRNLVRVFKEVEEIRDKLTFAEPFQNLVSPEELNMIDNQQSWQCRTKNEEGVYEHLVDKVNKKH